MSLPEKSLQHVVKRDPPEAFARRLERNFESLDNRDVAFSDFGKTLVDDADAAAARTTLGLSSFGTWFAVPNYGNSAAAAITADLNYYAQIVVPGSCTLTGISFFMATIGTGNTCRVSLYNSAGTRVANRSTNSSALSALTFPKIDFTSTYAAIPGVYFANIVFANTQGTALMTNALSPSGTAAGPGSAATLTSVTPPTVAGAGVPTMTTY